MEDTGQDRTKRDTGLLNKEVESVLQESLPPAATPVEGHSRTSTLHLHWDEWFCLLKTKTPDDKDDDFHLWPIGIFTDLDTSPHRGQF